MSVLDDIIAGVLDDLKEREDRVPLSRVKEMEQSVPEAKDALGVLRNRDGAVKIISEVKRSSPSKGALARAVGDAGEGAPCIAGTAGTTGVKTHVSHLRAKLRAFDPDVEHIDTVWGLGYRMAPL